jgi:integrase
MAKIIVRNFPTQKPRRRAANREWLDAFLTQADRDALPHLAACVMFMWQTGTRVGEAVRLVGDEDDLMLGRDIL